MMSTLNVSKMNEKTRLLTPYDVSWELGISYENAVALMRAHGIKFGRRYYITREKLNQALSGERVDFRSGEWG